MNPSPDSAYHQARILIVDDERHNRQLLEVMLTPEGFHLLTAAGAREQADAGQLIIKNRCYEDFSR